MAVTTPTPWLKVTTANYTLQHGVGQNIPLEIDRTAAAALGFGTHTGEIWITDIEASCYTKMTIYFRHYEATEALIVEPTTNLAYTGTEGVVSSFSNAKN